MPMTLDGTAGMTAPQGAVYNGLQTATAQASTSGTSIDFTGIPVWVKRVTVMLNGVSTNGTSNLLIQIGSGSITTSGYVGSSGDYDGTSAAASTSTTGIRIGGGSSAAITIYANVVFNLISGNTWVASGVTVRGNAANVGQTAGAVTLSGVLDRVRITTVGGTDTFDAGTINIMYE